MARGPTLAHWTFIMMLLAAFQPPGSFQKPNVVRWPKGLDIPGLAVLSQWSKNALKNEAAILNAATTLCSSEWEGPTN